ncbi:hypothetical protein HD599_001178 [Conyzicola lurida]|uniref:SGNH hydrolase-type esterase domain-containing protein n=1 Tax=Conyzicola lurida TaxID=1172621 RepID=A0A841AMV1_9MICO|nr:GDSL-type esterase/lipase family protein [Conyzicola lurida]MBB5842855.1 hypothetical protein [Conyzicola lurida]
MLRAPIVPSPSDEPTIRPASEDPDLVLILGNGTAHGWGVTTYQLALPGQLSREMERVTGRECHVHYIGDESMDVSSTRQWLSDHDASVYDVVLVVVGVSDAVQLTSEQQWTEALDELLTDLRQRTKPAARFLLAGIQPLRSIVTLDSALGGVADRHATRLNLITRAIAASDSKTEFYPLPPAAFEQGQPFGSAGLYKSRAQEFAPAIAPLVAAVRADEGGSRTPRRL